MLLVLAVVLTQAPDLEQIRGHNRVVLIFAADEQNARLKTQQSAFEDSVKGLQERDMKVFAVTGNAREVAYLRHKFGIGDAAFAVVLIGKDGGSKMKMTRVVQPSELFQLIDSMPMRKAELRRNAGKAD